MAEIESQSAYLALKENKPKAIHTHIKLVILGGYIFCLLPHQKQDEMPHRAMVPYASGEFCLHEKKMARFLPTRV